MKTLMRNGRDRRSENPFLGHAKKERVGLFGTDQRITSGPAARRPHSKAEYMTAPERFADSQIPLAPRAPSIHDPMAGVGFGSSRQTLMARLPALARWAQTGFGLLERRHRRDQRVGDGLPGWAYRIRTAESGRGLPDWICVTTWPEVGASPAAETLRVRAA